MTEQIDELMALVNDLLFAPNRLRKKKSQALRTAIEVALNPHALRSSCSQTFISCSESGVMNIKELKTQLAANGFTVFRDAVGPVDVIDGRTLSMSTLKVKPADEFVAMLRQRQFTNISLYSIPSEGTIRFAGW